jgi:glycolate oxidase iron-sulfur subunit
VNDRLAQCIQCGLCLPACPTYALTPYERANPRGRIGLMRAVARGDLEAADPAFAEAMYYCVGCRACETACPAGVEFGWLLEEARATVEDAGGGERPGEFPLSILLDSLPHPRRLRYAARLARLHQRTLGRSGLWRRLVERRPALAHLESLAPAVPPQGRRWRLPGTIEPSANGDGRGPAPRGTVAIHPGCIQQVLLPEINADTAQVLAHHAWRVVVPEGFRCCGALHAHQGRLDAARDLARANIAAFEASGAERMVSNAAGCGAHMKAYVTLLEGDPAWRDRAAEFAARVVDVSEHLAHTGLRRPKRPFSLKVTYDDPCHLLHGQRVAEAPRMLLGAVPGLEVVPLAESAWCCGSAGVYNLTRPEASRALLDRKIGHIVATGAELVVTGNVGCILQIAAGLREAGLPIRVLHPVSLLRAAYELPPLLPR